MVRGANSTPPPPAAWLQHKFPLSSPHQCLHLLSSALTSPCCSCSTGIPVMVRYSLLCIVSISVVRLVLAGPCVWCHDPGPVVPPQLGAAQGWSHNYSIVWSRPAPAADTPSSTHTLLITGCREMKVWMSSCVSSVSSMSSHIHHAASRACSGGCPGSLSVHLVCRVVCV